MLNLLDAVTTVERLVLAPLAAPVHTILHQSFPHAYTSIATGLTAIQSPHSRALPLMDPVQVLILIAAYLIAVFGGMMLMRSSARFELKWMAFLHNCSMVSLSGYMMVGIISEAARADYVVWGNPVDHSSRGLKMARLIWLFYISKIFEFIDTFIMVLKKNNHQVSFLHMYHHTSIFAIWWVITFIAPGGESYFSAALNSFIHVVMYGYYLCASLGIKQVAFVKKYITAMQMTQFAAMLSQSVYLLLHPSPYKEGAAPYPRSMAVLLFWYMISMLVLFGSFFRATYLSKSVSSRKSIKSPLKKD